MRPWLYWIATAWLTFELAVGGAIDLIRGPENIFIGKTVDAVVSDLGYPVYVLLFLGIFKILGAAAIIAPGLVRLKEWAYAGSFFQITLALGSHAIVGSSFTNARTNFVYPLLVMLITLVSWALRPADRRL